jgi:hypothetical protein
MDNLRSILRTSRMDHQAKTRKHHFLLTENHIKILSLINMLSNEMPISVRFIRCCTAFDLGGIDNTLMPPANIVHDWVLAVFMHECIVHKVLDYELTNLHVTSPANTWMQISLEARSDIEQMRASGLINTFEFSSSRLALSTISGSPWTTGNRRNGMVNGLSLTSTGLEKANLLLRMGKNELMSIITADVGYDITVPRRILWHEIRKEFLLCEALDTANSVNDNDDTTNFALGISGNSSQIKSAQKTTSPTPVVGTKKIVISSPNRYRSPLPLPPSPLKLSQMKRKKNKYSKNIVQPETFK